jgi:hypothetical protein
MSKADSSLQSFHSQKHIVDSVLAFSPVVGIGTSLPPHPQASVPPPFGSGGEGHTRLRERGWGSPNSNEGTYTVVLKVYVYEYVLCGQKDL